MKPNQVSRLSKPIQTFIQLRSTSDKLVWFNEVLYQKKKQTKKFQSNTGAGWNQSKPEPGSSHALSGFNV